MKENELLLAVLAHIERERTVSIPQLARLLDTDESDITKALETLVFAYDAASIRLDLHDTYATLSACRPERLLRLTAREADTLIDALQAAGFTTNDELVRKFIDTKSLIKNSGDIPTPRIKTVSKETKTSVAQTLMSSCEDESHHLARISYCGEKDTSPQPRIVEPAGIFSKKGARYLLAFCRKADGWRTFRLDRIKSVDVLEDQFTPRKDIPNATDEFKRALVKTHVRFAPDTPIPPWPGTRVTKTLEDGGRIASVDWVGGAWLPKHIVACMGTATPLDPPELIEACRRFAGSLSAD